MVVLKRLILAIVVVIAFLACEREFVFRGGEEGLLYSTDTVMFDTIFTTIGSTTQNFKIYNPYNEDLVIDAIELAGGESSNYRLNINGFATDLLTDVQVRAKDSLYVFVEVTIDPVESNTPIIVTDSVIITTSKKQESIKLVAYGQDVVLLKKAIIKTQTFTKDKPYLIYDYLLVDTAETLTIEAVAKLYFHKDASMLVVGDLFVEGTLEEPVKFLGHRLEDWYKDKPGQWGYIHFLPGSGGSVINYAEIKNAQIGVLVDSVGVGDAEPITFTNTTIEHISSFGLLAQTSNIIAANCLFADCGTQSLAITVGGSYDFTHCTFANYYDWAFRTTPAVFLNNYYIDANNKKQVVPLTRADFKNCIIYGRNLSEIGFDLEAIEGVVNNGMSYTFDNSLIKMVRNYNNSNENNFIIIIGDIDPSFKAPYDYNYQLDTLSAAKDMAYEEYARNYPEDILGQDRFEDKGPDVGLYERKEN